MKLLTRYLVREFLKILVVCLVVFVAVYLIVDFLQKIDNFMESGASRSVMAAYFFYKTPFIIGQMFPSATLISVIILFSLMRKSREITALKACGVNLAGVFRSLVIVAVVLSAGLFVFSEIVVRNASARTNEIWTFEVIKRDPGKYYYGHDHIWYRGQDRIYWIWSFDAATKVMEHPTLYFFDESFGLKRRIVARRGYWEADGWVVLDGYEQVRQEDGDFAMTEFASLRLELPETPETFVRTEKQPEEMSYWELRDYARKVSLEGYDNTRYLVGMHIKIAFPFIVLIMMLIGIPVPLIQTRVRTPLSVSIGMGIGFLYMLLFGFSRSLGLSGVLPPLLAAWLANLVFLLLGIYLVSLVER